MLTQLSDSHFKARGHLDARVVALSAIAGLSSTIGCSTSMEPSASSAEVADAPAPSVNFDASVSDDEDDDSEGDDSADDTEDDNLDDDADDSEEDDDSIADDAVVSDAGSADAGSAIEPRLELADIRVGALLTPNDDDFDELEPLRGVELDAMVAAPCSGAIEFGRQIDWMPSADGTLRVRVDSDLPHVSLLQSECGVQNTTKGCREPSVTSELVAPLSANEPVCLVLGYTDEAVIQAQVSEPACGDGALNPNTEACDDGALQPGDGCSPSCQFEPAPAVGNHCPGESHTLTNSLQLSGFTVGYDSHAPATGGAFDAAADKVFAILPAASGTLSATASGDFDLTLSLFTSCDDNSLEDLLACSDDAIPTAAEHVTGPVEEQQLYFVVVDGYSPTQQGRFTLDLQLTPDEGAL